jgi:hypothetical protein
MVIVFLRWRLARGDLGLKKPVQHGRPIMFSLKSLGSARNYKAPAEIASSALTERREEDRRAVFQGAILTLEDYDKIRAIITDLGERGARVQYAMRRDLPFRVRINAPGLKLKCWARVVWQKDGAAGLEFLPSE